MNARNLNGVVILLAATGIVLLTACDAVRSGTYDGDYPDSMTVNIPQTPEFQATVTQAASAGQLSLFQPLAVTLRSWRLTSGRYWKFAGRGIVNLTGLEQGTLPSKLDVDVWPVLGSVFDLPTEDDPPSVVAGIVEVSASPAAGGPLLVAADVEHVLFAAIEDVNVQPIGPAGPTLAITRGFHVFRRACAPDGAPSFTEVPLAVVAQPIELGVVPATSSSLRADPFVAGCGVDASAPIDLGTVAAPIPPDPVIATLPVPLDPSLTLPMTVESFGWTPGADAVYLLARRPADGYLSALPSAQLRQWIPGASLTTLVTSDDLASPLAIATGGTSVLVWHQTPQGWDYIRQSLTAALTPLQLTLSDFNSPGPTGSSLTALSADGNFLALTSAVSSIQAGPQLQFVDLRTAATVMRAVPDPFGPAPPAANGYTVVPRAWDPTGATLLVESWHTPDMGGHAFATIAVDSPGALPTVLGAPVPLPAVVLPAALASGRSTDSGVPPDAALRYFWSASGPQALIQDAEGARVYNFVTQQTTTLVEPTLVATADSGVDAVVATEQVFAWAGQCSGLGETACRTALRRLTLGTGVVDVVATAERTRPFAVSPDGKQLVVADDTSIYLKTIGP